VMVFIITNPRTAVTPTPPRARTGISTFIHAGRPLSVCGCWFSFFSPLAERGDS
jgi:hypothetical protein